MRRVAGGEFPVARVSWPNTYRLVLSHYPPIDLYDDIADPHDWDLIAAAVQRTNPRLAESLGALDAVPVARRIAGEGGRGGDFLELVLGPDAAAVAEGAQAALGGDSRARENDNPFHAGVRPR